MINGKLYEYVAYFVPTKEQEAAGKDASILVDGKIIAESEETARRKAIRGIPTEYEQFLDQIKVEVRAFR